MLRLVAVFLAILNCVIGDYCQSTINVDQTHRTLVSPNYPRPYNPNQNCSWLLIAPAGQSVHIEVADLSLERGYDFLRIFDGSSISSSLLAALSFGLGTYQSTGQYMLVNFTSDSSNQGYGFSASYYAVASAATTDCTTMSCLNNGICLQLLSGGICYCVGPWTGNRCELPQSADFSATTGAFTATTSAGDSGCGGPQFLNATATEQIITSMNYPQNYDPYADCTWQITAPSGYIVLFRVADIQLEWEYDFLRTYDGQTISRESLLRTYKSVGRVLSSGQYMSVRFTSDESEERRGFQAFYSAVSPQSQSTSAASTTSVCRWNPCLNQGACSNGRYGEVFCVCTSGYTGRYCETATSSSGCTSMCQHGGSCVAGKCNCFGPWRGTYCEVYTPGASTNAGTSTQSVSSGCLSSSCLNNGACSRNQYGQYVCSCPSTYTGSRCEIPVLTGCYNGGCRNGGTCYGGICICTIQWMGATCETAVAQTTAAPSGANGQRCTSSKIVGGSAATPSKVPWQAQLFYRNSFTCGGSLVASQWIVTAGHCVKGQTIASRWKVRLGGYNYQPQTGDGQIYSVDQVLLYNNYIDSNINENPVNDVALLHLSQPATLGTNVGYISLPTSTVPAGTCCTISGFGTIADGQDVMPSVLQFANIPIVDRSVCNQRDHYNNEITNEMLCAGYEAGGVDSCQGDSGGPLACPVNNQWQLTGVTSYGAGCGVPKMPGIYTNLILYVGWIKNITGLP